MIKYLVLLLILITSVPTIAGLCASLASNFGNSLIGSLPPNIEAILAAAGVVPMCFNCGCVTSVGWSTSSFATVKKAVENYQVSSIIGESKDTIDYSLNSAECVKATLSGEDVDYYNQRVSITSVEEGDSNLISLTNNNLLCHSIISDNSGNELKVVRKCDESELISKGIDLFKNRPYQEESQILIADCEQHIIDIFASEDTTIRDIILENYVDDENTSDYTVSVDSSDDDFDGFPFGPSGDSSPFGRSESEISNDNKQTIIDALCIDGKYNWQGSDNFFTGSKDRFCRASLALLDVSTHSDNSALAGWGCIPEQASEPGDADYNLCDNEAEGHQERIDSNNGDFVLYDKVYMYADSSYEQFKGYKQTCSSSDTGELICNHEEDNNAFASFQNLEPELSLDEGEIYFTSNYIYDLKTSQTCGNNAISDKWRCKLAASVLNLPVNNEFNLNGESKDGLPSGCTLNQEGFLVFNTQETAVDCSETNPCICQNLDSWCLDNHSGDADGGCELDKQKYDFEFNYNDPIDPLEIMNNMANICQNIYLFTSNDIITSDDNDSVNDGIGWDDTCQHYVDLTSDEADCNDKKVSLFDIKEREDGINTSDTYFPYQLVFNELIEIETFKKYFLDNNDTDMLKKAQTCFDNNFSHSTCNDAKEFLNHLLECSCGFIFNGLDVDRSDYQQKTDDWVIEDNSMFIHSLYCLGLGAGTDECLSTYDSCFKIQDTCDNSHLDASGNNEVYIDCGGKCDEPCVTENVRFVNNNWYNMISYWYGDNEQVPLTFPPNDIQESIAVEKFLDACNNAVNEIFGVNCVSVSSNSRPHLSGLTITFGGKQDNIDRLLNVVNPEFYGSTEDGNSTTDEGYTADSWIWLTQPCQTTLAIYPDDQFESFVYDLEAQPINQDSLTDCLDYRLYEGLVSSGSQPSDDTYYNIQYDVGLGLEYKDHLKFNDDITVDIIITSKGNGKGLSDIKIQMTPVSGEVGLYESKIPKVLLSNGNYDVFFSINNGFFQEINDAKISDNEKIFGAPLRECRGDTLYYQNRDLLINNSDDYTQPPSAKKVNLVKNNLAFSYNIQVNNKHTSGDNNCQIEPLRYHSDITNGSDDHVFGVLIQDGDIKSYINDGGKAISNGAEVCESEDDLIKCLLELQGCIGIDNADTTDNIKHVYSSHIGIIHFATETEPFRLCSNECRCKRDFCSSGTKSQDGQVCCDSTFAFGENGAENYVTFECEADAFGDICDPNQAPPAGQTKNCYHSILDSQIACSNPSDTNCILGPNNALGCQGAANSMNGVVPNTCVQCDSSGACIDAYCIDPNEVFHKEDGCVLPEEAFSDYCDGSGQTLFSSSNCTLWPTISTSLVDIPDQPQAIAVRATAPFAVPPKMVWRFWIENCVGANDEARALVNLDILAGQRSSCEDGCDDATEGCSTCQWRQTINQIQDEGSCFNKQATFGVSEVFMVEITAFLISEDIQYSGNTYESQGAYNSILTQMFSKKGYKLMVRKRTIVTGTTDTTLKAVLETSIMSVDFQHDIVLNIYATCPSVEDSSASEEKTSLAPGEPVQLQVSVSADSGILSVNRIEVETFKQMGRFGLEFVFIAGGVEKYDQMFARFIRLGAKPCIEFIPMSQVKYDDNTATFYVSGILVIGNGNDGRRLNNIQDLFVRRLQDSASNQEAELTVNLLDVAQDGAAAAVGAESENQMQSKKFPFVATLVVVSSVVITAALIVLGIVVHAASSSSSSTVTSKH